MVDAVHGAATKLMGGRTLDGITKTALEAMRPGAFMPPSY